MRFFWLALIALLPTACRQQIDNAPKAGDVLQVPAFEWRVVDQHTLEQEYIKAGRTLGANQHLRGFAGYTLAGTQVVYTLPPSGVDDRATTTLGHEVLHLVLGEYHTP